MYVVMTKVKLKPGTSKQCAELFQRTNPELVKDEDDWLGARMIFDSDTNIVTVLATWRNREAYKALSASSAFQDAMKGFGAFFAKAPDISVNELLVDM